MAEPNLSSPSISIPSPTSPNGVFHLDSLCHDGRVVSKPAQPSHISNKRMTFFDFLKDEANQEQVPAEDTKKEGETKEQVFFYEFIKQEKPIELKELQQVSFYQFVHEDAVAVSNTPRELNPCDGKRDDDEASSTLTETEADMDGLSQTILDLVGFDCEPASLSDAVLIIVGMQNEYISTGSVPLHNVEMALHRGQELLEMCRREGTPVIHVVHYGRSGGGFYDPIGEGGKINELVAPMEGEPIVEKDHANAFLGTDLLEKIKNTGRNELIVIGFMTHLCVSSTVRHAIEVHGLKCTVVASATATRDIPVYTRLAKNKQKKEFISADQVQKASLAALTDFFCCVVDNPSDRKSVV